MLAKGFYMIKAITLEDYEKDISSKNKITLLYFYADWCGASRILSPVIEMLNTEYGKDIMFCKVNIDVQKELTDKFDFPSTPAVYILKNGKTVSKAVGVKPGAFYRKMIKEARET